MDLSPSQPHLEKITVQSAIPVSAKIGTRVSHTISKIPIESDDGKVLLFYDYTITGAHHTTTIPRQRSHSFVQQFLQLLYIPMAQRFTTSVRKTDGTFDAISLSYSVNYDFHTSASANDSTYGLQVGTGTAAVTIGDYKLQTQITHGVGAGQLQHGAGAGATVTSTSSTASLVLSRVFSNASGGTITVNEIGIVGERDSTSSKHCLLARDVVSPITILNGEQLTLNYTIETNV